MEINFLCLITEDLNLFGLNVASLLLWTVVSLDFQGHASGCG